MAEDSVHNIDPLESNLCKYRETRYRTTQSNKPVEVASLFSLYTVELRTGEPSIVRVNP